MHAHFYADGEGVNGDSEGGAGVAAVEAQG